MDSHDKVIQIIYEVIDDTNADRPAESALEKTPEAILFGEKGKLDSLGMVHFIVGVEERLSDELGVSITLADERAMSQKNSPFRSVSTLAAYIEGLMEAGS